jgi:hypothetical protein
VVRALNEAKVATPWDESETAVAGVMVIVGTKEAGAPLGGSLNFDRETGVWSIDDMPSMGQPLEE